jgi:sugar phosphate isomerase/epimerase
MREVVAPTFYSLSQPIPEGLEKLAEAGVRLIEIHGDQPDTHIDLMNELQVDALAALVGRIPVEVHSVHCAFSRPSEDFWDISQLDDTKREAAIRNRVKVLGATAKLRARHMIIHPGIEAHGDDRIANCRASLARLAETARNLGVMIAVENLPTGYLGDSVSEMKQVLAGLDPEVVGFCLDTGHAMLGPDEPNDYIRALGDRMIAIHWHGNDGTDDQHLFPGDGRTEWDGFLAALDEVGYDLPITVEALPPEGMSLSEAARAIRDVLQRK